MPPRKPVKPKVNPRVPARIKPVTRKPSAKLPPAETRQGASQSLSVFDSDLSSFYQFVELKEPALRFDSRRRDTWLSQVWRKEPHLAGTLSSVVSIDKNRGWSIIGSEREIDPIAEMLLYDTENGQGWRELVSKLSTAYYSTDLGAIMEFGRLGEVGPLRGLWSVDPTVCRLTGERKRPLEYVPTDGKKRGKWSKDWFARFCSMPLIEQRLAGLGFCAISRAIEFTKLMVGIFQHDLEMVGAKMPKGIMLLQNIEEDQWKTALAARKVANESLERQWFGGVMTICSSGIEQADIKLVALSQLPANFDKNVFTSLTMYGYSLCFGYDPSELWPVQFGSLGRGTEMELQHRKSTAKGGLNFALDMQARLQSVLPRSLLFEFEQRDALGETVDAELRGKNIDNIVALYEAGLAEGFPLLGTTIEQARQRAMALLIENGIAPEEWSVIEADSTATDSDPTTERNREFKRRVMETLQVRRAAKSFPNEPIVSFNSTTGRKRVLWKTGSEVYPFVMRAVSLPLDELKRLIAQGGTPEDVRDSYQRALAHAIAEYKRRGYNIAGLRSIFEQAINTAWPYLFTSAWTRSGNRRAPDTTLLELAIQREVGFAFDFADRLWSARHEEDDEESINHFNALGFAGNLAGWFNETLLRGLGNRVLVWELGTTQEHCRTCRTLNGQAHRASFYLANNYIPGRAGCNLECGGWQCLCRLKLRTGQVVSL